MPGVRLPDIGGPRDLSRAMAMAEAVLDRHRWSRHHTFTTGWAEGVDLAARDNGAGDHYAIVFSGAGRCSSASTTSRR